MTDLIARLEGEAEMTEAPKIEIYAGIMLLYKGMSNEACVEQAFRETGTNVIPITLPCGHAVVLTRENFPLEDIKCPNNGLCGAEKCWVVKFQPIRSPPSEAREKANG